MILENNKYVICFWSKTYFNRSLSCQKLKIIHFQCIFQHIILFETEINVDFKKYFTTHPYLHVWKYLSQRLKLYENRMVTQLLININVISHIRSTIRCAYKNAMRNTILHINRNILSYSLASSSRSFSKSFTNFSWHMVSILPCLKSRKDKYKWFSKFTKICETHRLDLTKWIASEAVISLNIIRYIANATPVRPLPARQWTRNG